MTGDEEKIKEGWRETVTTSTSPTGPTLTP